MKILALETSTLTGSIAFLEDEEIRAETILSVSVRHSERLMPAMNHLLESAGVSISEIDLYAVALGPGSFTGLRIGIATAQGLALAQDKPLIGISTLEALAMNGILFSGLVAPILDAFRGEVYWGLFKTQEKVLKRIEEDQISGLEDFRKRFQEMKEPVLILGNLFGPPAFRYPRASNVGLLALYEWQKGVRENIVLPQYLRIPG